MQRPPIFEPLDGHLYVLKLDQDARDFPAAELLGACLAEALELPTPPFAILDAPAALCDGMRASGDPDLGGFVESFERRGGCCFGSRYLPGVVVKWRPELRSAVPGADAVLARILAFDGFIENMDRSAAHNPNLLVSNGQLFAIDHGQALPSVHGAASSGPPFPYDSHIAWTTVENWPQLLRVPSQAVQRLSDDGIDSALDAVPSAWWTAAGRLAAVRAALRHQRDAVPDTLNQLMERLR
jgi:hypothetical protein